MIITSRYVAHFKLLVKCYSGFGEFNLTVEDYTHVLS